MEQQGWLSSRTPNPFYPGIIKPHLSNHTNHEGRQSGIIEDLIQLNRRQDETVAYFVASGRREEELRKSSTQQH
jgi:hypothetical protein